MFDRSHSNVYVSIPFQCIVLATRPLLMCLIRELLARRTQSPGRNNRGLADPIKALLRTSHESAAKSLEILIALQAQHLLGK